MRHKTRIVTVAVFASIILAGLASIAASSAASAAIRTKTGAKFHGAITIARSKTPIERGSKLGLEALGVTGSYGYGDDYPSYGSQAYNDNGQSRRVTSHRGLREGRAAAVGSSVGYVPPDGRGAYETPESTYGRQTSNYGPGVIYAAPVSPYRWAYSSENFPGTEFMGGR
jgi:hypothetical protein